jgi:hypothetical protein
MGRSVICYVEVSMPYEPYDTSVISEVDTHYCSMGLHCAAVDPAPLGNHFTQYVNFAGFVDEGVSWTYPFVPADVDETDTRFWVCEDCAGWIEDMHALRELFIGLP